MKFITVFFAIAFLKGYGQNLVPNPSFEESTGTITRFTENSADFNTNMAYWSSPNKASPDLITPKFSEKYIIPPPAHSGVNMAGIQFNEENWCEYLKVELTKPLLPNKTYYAEFWIRRSYCISPSMKVDQNMDAYFGMLFSNDNIDENTGEMLFGDPQVIADPELIITDKEWFKICSYFTPSEPMRFLYLGQFKKETARDYIKRGYYVIDDVLVEEIKGFESLNLEETLPEGSLVPMRGILFKSGTTDFANNKSYDDLNTLIEYLKNNPSLKVRINGHTDNVGSDQQNLMLSKKRARFVANKVIEKGIRKTRVKWKGFGESSPIADNNHAKGRLKNRRVEIEIIH